MPVMNQGPSRFDGVSAIKLTANMSQITISDSPDSQVHTEKTNGAILTTRHEGTELKVTGNMAHIDLKVPPGVAVAITNNLSTITDKRTEASQVSPQSPGSVAGQAPEPLASLRSPAQESIQSFEGVRTIELVNRLGSVEIHRGEPGSATKIHYNGAAVIDQDGSGLDIVNQGATITIITPESTRITHAGLGQVVDRRFD